jgi:hypothetical protein
MSPTKLPREQIEALRPGNVRLYLASRGWATGEIGPSQRAVEFTNPAYPGVELLLPMKRELGDFTLRMADVVAGLSAVERRPASEILSELLGAPGDVVRLRMVARDTALGNLPLDEGLQFLRGGRDMLLAAAFSTLRPRTLHPFKMPREVKAFLRSCRLGQTERGSFVATIITPVPPELQKLMEFDDPAVRMKLEPYPRRVTMTLMSTLGFVSSSIKEGDPARILEGVDQGVSANLCEALKEMRPPGDQSHLDISVSWARNRGQVPQSVPQSVSFPQDSFPIIEEAARELRVRAFARRTTYRGKLIGTELVHRPFVTEPVGRIIMVGEVAGETSRLKVDLTPEDFARACAALPGGKQVRVTGVIRNDVKTRIYELSDPQDFEVIEDDWSS